jgi:glycosyltransferase involved in cell wall biosynthesis/mannosyltransferase OCH1-like enzyme
MSSQISLVMTVYNRQQYLAQAIDSILAQTYPHWQLIIWDDGSTDNSPKIGQQYADQDPRIQFIAAAHQGRSPALADAVAATDPHPYLAFIDSDDLLAPNALASTLAILEQQATIGVVYSNYLLIDAQGKLQGSGSRCDIPYSPQRLLVDFMTFQFRLLRRTVYDQVGGIDRQFPHAEDYDLCLKLSEITEFHHLPAPLYYYRKHADTISSAQRSQQIEYSGKAVERALLRRGMTDRYQLTITPTGQFHLQTKPPQATIPKIIHQTWKTAQLPPHLAALQQTWQAQHPDWEYRLWTDDDNRAFLVEHYPWFLPTYDRYKNNICRIDAVRYFWLHHYGGLYVDLDFECLGAIDQLLAGESLVLSLEPAAHLTENQRVQNRSQILSPAWMASAPQHPFWPHLWSQLTERAAAPDPLIATGPFLLSDAYQSYPSAADITLIPPAQLHPLSLQEMDQGQWLDLSKRAAISHSATAVHHWQGSWWKPERSEALAATSAITVLEQGQTIIEAQFNYNTYRSLHPNTCDQPLISCLMVTKNRPLLAQKAIFCFLQQSYAHKELVIVDDSDDHELEKFVSRFPHPQITYSRTTDQSSSLGDLRNMAISKAAGTYICQWDDDDLCDPWRLAMQMAVIQSFRVDGCLLSKLQLWWPHQQRLATSFRRLWEGTLLCCKDIFPAYPSLAQGEDTAVMEILTANQRIAALDCPELYLYICHQQNTCRSEHFDRHWQSSSIRREKDAYVAAMQPLIDRLPIYSYLQAITAPLPLISCLMVTKNRERLAKLSIGCFQRQTYAHKELIVIDDGESPELANFIQSLNDPQIVHYHLPSENLTLGELRNISIAKANGSYLSQWDDDDLSDPARLTDQMNAIQAQQVDGCFLDAVYVWWPHQQRFALSRQRVWEGTLLCRKELFPSYANLRRGEDTIVVDELLKNHQIVPLNRPWLYLYGVHQQNTWDPQHFDTHWQMAQSRFIQDAYWAAVQKLSDQLPTSAYLKALQLPTRSNDPAPNQDRGINVAGFVNEGFGINEGVQYCLAALQAQQIPCGFNPMAKGRSETIGDPPNSTNPYPVNLLHANPNMLLDPQQRVLTSLGDRYFQGKYNIGYWVWESQQSFPQQWMQAFQHFDEIWTPSSYSQSCLARVSPIPVITIPHSIQLPSIVQHSRADLGLPTDSKVFLFIYDALSLAARKNPEGVIKAFNQAFDVRDRRATLILKTKGLSPSELEKLTQLIAAHPQIKIINAHFDRDQLNALLYHCDCYVSLHRSEGFGLTLAEAMFYGKPTIATGFSGNMDFMNSHNSFLVKYRPITLGENISYFATGTIWAEPDLMEVSHYLRQVVENPDLAAKIGQRAAQDMRSHLSPAAIGAKIQARLEIIQGNQSRGSARSQRKSTPVPIAR